MSQIKSSPHIEKVNRLRSLAQLLDNAIPIPLTKYRIGLDPILGLIPGGGDTVTGALGAYIVIEAARMGLPRKILWQMVGNILLDSLVGTIPVLGDFFDVGWKANVKNMVLLENHLEIVPRKRKSDTLFLFILIVILTIIVIGFASLTFLILSWLWNFVS